MADSQAEAVAALLRQAPRDWADAPTDAEPLTILTAAGFVERRITFTIRLPGDGIAQRITIEATGECGLAEAMQAVVQDLWARGGQRLQGEIGEPVRPLVVRQHDQWRLTAEGRLAVEDLERGQSTPIDFALKRGFFDGRARAMPDGRIVRREPVRGYGRLVTAEILPSAPVSVAITNWEAGAEAFRKALQAIEQAGQGPPRPAAPTPAKSDDECLLARDGSGWRIRAFGEEGHFADLAGFQYIRRLLERPGRPVPMQYVVGGCVGATSANQAAADGLHQSRDIVLDDRALGELHRKLREYDAAITDAEARGDTTTAEVLQTERLVLLKWLPAASGTNRLRSRIHKAIKTVCRKLRAVGMVKTADHFDLFIGAQGDDYLYNPPTPPSWALK